MKCDLNDTHTHTHDQHQRLSSKFHMDNSGDERAFTNCWFGSFDQHFTTQNETKYTQHDEQKKNVTKNDTSANAITKWRLEHNICHMNETYTTQHNTHSHLIMQNTTNTHQ